MVYNELGLLAMEGKGKAEQRENTAPAKVQKLRRAGCFRVDSAVQLDQLPHV